jgi:hypothetical protein
MLSQEVLDTVQVIPVSIDTTVVVGSKLGLLDKFLHSESLFTVGVQIVEKFIDMVREGIGGWVGHPQRGMFEGVKHDGAGKGGLNRLDIMDQRIVFS